MGINHARSHDLNRQWISITLFKQLMLHQNFSQVITVFFIRNLFYLLQKIFFFITGQFSNTFDCWNKFLDWKVVLKFDQVNYLLILIFRSNDILSSFQKEINSRFDVKSVNDNWFLKQFYKVLAASCRYNYFKLRAIVFQFFN
jgi:hypothetical protein